ncbi:MAG: hypothetical protein ACK4VX_14460, partial [Polaromonas sp.]
MNQLKAVRHVAITCEVIVLRWAGQHHGGIGKLTTTKEKTMTDAGAISIAAGLLIGLGAIGA